MGFLDFARNDTKEMGAFDYARGRHGKSDRKADRQIARMCRPAQRVLTRLLIFLTQKKSG